MNEYGEIPLFRLRRIAAGTPSVLVRKPDGELKRRVVICLAAASHASKAAAKYSLSDISA
jgi:hypothetical protein